MTCETGEDYLPFAEIPSLRNMVLTGEDDGDMSYMRLQQRQLKPGASSRRGLPPAHDPHRSSDGRDGSAVVPYHGGRQTSDDYMVPSGQGRYSQHSGGQQGYRGQLDRGNPEQHRYYNDQGYQYGRNHHTARQDRR